MPEFKPGDLVRLKPDAQPRNFGWYFGQVYRVIQQDPHEKWMVQLRNVREEAMFRCPVLFEWDLELVEGEVGNVAL